MQHSKPFDFRSCWAIFDVSLRLRITKCKAWVFKAGEIATGRRVLEAAQSIVVPPRAFTNINPVEDLLAKTEFL